MTERDPDGHDTWRRALLGVVVLSLLCAPVSWLDDGITPSWIVYPILLLVALWRIRAGHGALLVGIAALVFLLVHIPFTWAALSGAEDHPVNEDLSVSPVQWVITLFLVPALASGIGLVTWRKERVGPASP